MIDWEQAKPKGEKNNGGKIREMKRQKPMYGSRWGK